MDATTFPNVWYRSRAIGSTEVTMKAMEDRGTLTVSAGKLVFEGKKQTVEITDIESVESRREGRDFVNKWVIVTHPTGEARFVDGRLLGWSGLLGGNKKLLTTIQQAASG
jgi:hypothetical protein